MTRHMRLTPNFLVAVAALAFGVAAPKLWAAPLEATTIIVEVNATDGDAGIQIFLDGQAWKQMKVFDPAGNEIFDVAGAGKLGMLGLTELFSESEEPPLDEVPIDQFLAKFPAGKYTFVGTTVDGKKLSGTATFTHAIPAGPVVVFPGEGAVLDPSDVTIMWEPVSSPFPGTSATINIIGYQVIVERQREKPKPLPVFSANLPVSAREVTVPRQFLQPGTAYKFEVLAIEASGNQTITEGNFNTTP